MDIQNASSTYQIIGETARDDPAVRKVQLPIIGEITRADPVVRTVQLPILGETTRDAPVVRTSASVFKIK